MSSRNPFRNMRSLTPPEPPSYESAMGSNHNNHNNSYSEDKSERRYRDEKSSYNQYPSESMDRQVSQRDQFQPPSGPPPMNPYHSPRQDEAGPSNSYREYRDSPSTSHRDYQDGPSNSYRDPKDSSYRDYRDGPSSSYRDHRDGPPSSYRDHEDRDGSSDPYRENQEGPSSSSGKRSIPKMIKGIAGKNLLDPPPPQFNRQPPLKYSYSSFNPMALLSNSFSLQDGWPLTHPPASPGRQHPFAFHDVAPEDWKKFVQDLNSSTKLSLANHLIAGGAPLVMGVAPVTGVVISLALQKRMKQGKVGVVGDLIDAWNNYFFHPRHMSVVMAQGRKRLSGQTDDYPPDMGRHREIDERGDIRRHRSSSAHSYRSDYSDSDYDSDRSTRSLGRGKNHGHHGYDDRYGHSGHRDRYESERAPSQSQGKNAVNGLLSGLMALRDHRQSRRDARQDRKSDRRNPEISRGDARASRRAAKKERRDGPRERFRIIVCYFDGRREVF